MRYAVLFEKKIGLGSTAGHGETRRDNDLSFGRQGVLSGLRRSWAVSFLRLVLHPGTAAEVLLTSPAFMRAAD
jgi:hypothetical protein